jgi:hypothetical protein
VRPLPVHDVALYSHTFQFRVDSGPDGTYTIAAGVEIGGGGIGPVLPGWGYNEAAAGQLINYGFTIKEFQIVPVEAHEHVYL